MGRYIDMLDSAIDRYNDTYSLYERDPIFPTKYEAYQKLLADVQRDLRLLEDQYLEVLTNPKLDVLEELLATRKRIEIEATSHRDSIAELRDEIEIERRKYEEEIANLRTQLEGVNDALSNANSEIRRLEELVTQRDAELFRTSIKGVTPLKR